MATEEEVLDRLKREFDTWQQGKPTPFNTGYDGYGLRSAETATMSDLNAAALRFKDHVKGALGHLFEVRVAKSYSGEEFNEWSVLIERAGEQRPRFNFHMRVKG